MAKKVNKLVVDYDGEFEFTLLGISCAHKDYRLCYALNKVLDIEFIKAKNHELKLAKQTSVFMFGKYVATNEYGRKIFLINNKQDDNILLPDVKMLDYILMFEPKYDGDMGKLLQEIKDIKIVQTVVELDVQKIKSKHNLLY